jgi:hypothetical protein
VYRDVFNPKLIIIKEKKRTKSLDNLIKSIINLLSKNLKTSN